MGTAIADLERTGNARQESSDTAKDLAGAGPDWPAIPTMAPGGISSSKHSMSGGTFSSRTLMAGRGQLPCGGPPSLDALTDHKLDKSRLVEVPIGVDATLRRLEAP